MSDHGTLYPLVSGHRDLFVLCHENPDLRPQKFRTLETKEEDLNLPHFLSPECFQVTQDVYLLRFIAVAWIKR